MKKFMKAIALATVLCLALSTAAFATNSAVKGESDYTATVNVEAADGTQVALVIISGEYESTNDINEDNIVYIDQKAAASGVASFADVPVKGTPEKVSVFVGYEGLASGTNHVATLDIGPAMTITVSDGEGVAVAGSDGFGLGIKATVSKDANSAQMIWAVSIGDQRRYSDAIDIALLKGDVQFAATFANTNGLTADDVTNVGAIFAVNGDTANPIFTHSALDSGNGPK